MQSECGRDTDLLGSSLEELAQSKGMSVTGTSVFDPVLCEIMYNWFCPENGIVLDPFAGGPVRGVVAEMLGRRYIGIDLSQKQIDANQINADHLGVCPAWHCDDSRNMDNYLPDGSADLVFSCPPYHDLERYSDHPLDLSNMSYPHFLGAYEDIISTACRKLKENRFAVFVVGDIRDRKGAYRGFVGHTRQFFERHGLFFYNDMVLLTQLGTAPLRAGSIFGTKRKAVKVHQNVLVFYKGNMDAIRDTFTNSFRWADLEKYKR